MIWPLLCVYSGVEIDLENVSRVFRFRNFYDLPADQIISLIIPGGYRIGRETIRKSISSAGEGEFLPRLIGDAYPGIRRFDRQVRRRHIIAIDDDRRAAA